MDDLEITPQAETPEPAAPEDWRAKYKDELAKEYVPVQQYKGIQRELNKARQSPKVDLTEIEERIVSRLAPVFDHLATRDSDYEEEPKRRQLPSEMLKRPEQPKPQVDPAFQLAVQQVTDTAEKLGIKPGTQAWEDLITGEDGDARPPNEVLYDLHQKIIAQKVKDVLEAERLDAAKRMKDSGATKPDGAPSAAGGPEPRQPGDWDRAKATAKTPQELIKQFQGRI